MRVVRKKEILAMKSHPGIETREAQQAERQPERLLLRRTSEALRLLTIKVVVGSAALAARAQVFGSAIAIAEAVWRACGVDEFAEGAGDA